MKLGYLLMSALATLVAAKHPAPNCPPKPGFLHLDDQLTSFNEFVQTFYYDKNVSKAFLEHVDVNYIQHNPFALSGRSNAIAALSPFWPLATFGIIHKGLVNNTGYIHYRLDFPGSPPQAVIDILRFNASCIMEHWDIAESKPNGTINPIALF